MPPVSNAPDYLMLGHITRDLLPDGAFAPGGTALYASLTVERLGRSVGVVSAPAELPGGWPADIQMALRPELSAPTFENRYTPQGRVQILHTDAGQITIGDVPESWRGAPIVHLGPVAAEAPEALIDAFPQALLGVTPQGWMRSWGALPGPVSYKDWRPAPHVLQRIDALVLSIEDVHGDEELVRSWTAHCPLVALTRGANGSTLFVRGKPHVIEPFAAVESDPTGAGDVFAAALLVRLYETREPLEAARFASCVAARSVEGRGASAIPRRDLIDQLLEHP
jgi:sugar/nucleoside kinase (ribokinase family)